MLIQKYLASLYILFKYIPQIFWLSCEFLITEEDGQKLKNINIDLILKIVVVLVFTWGLTYLNGNATSYCHS